MTSTRDFLPIEMAKDAWKNLPVAVYSALYDFTNSQAQVYHTALPLPKEVFLINTMQHPNCIDTSLFAELDNRTCIFAIFWCLLNRVPDAQNLAFWEARAMKMTVPRFRKKLFQTLSHSLEARTKRVRYVSHTFDGIEKISCFQNAHLAMRTLENFDFFISACVVDRVVMWLFFIYKMTLRPTRIYFREKRKSRKAAKSSVQK